MTESEAKKELIDFWKNANFQNDMNIHKEDDEYVKKLFPISDSEKNLKNNNTIYSKLLPEPYIGNLSNAELFTVMLNPGFSENDFKAIHTKNFKNIIYTNSQYEYVC